MLLTAVIFLPTLGALVAAFLLTPGLAGQRVPEPARPPSSSPQTPPAAPRR